MNDSSLFGDVQHKMESRPPLGEDLLPPVEQPSARFIVQLFVVPALIVLLIVGTWLMFNWLVRGAQSGPEQLVERIENGPSVARWQRAKDLADMLRNKRYHEFRRSNKAAADLARTLEHEIDRADMTDNGVEFRRYLASALGELDVQKGVDVLLKAAKTDRDPREQRVRDAAIQAIAIRAYNLSQLDPPQRLENPELEAALLQLAEDADRAIRFQAAFVLGHLGTPAAIDRLESMVNDPDAGTRYNAAVALAHRGNPKSMETLLEMLDLEETAGVREEQAAGKAFKRTVIIVSAIQAVQALARQNPDADIAPAVAALKEIVQANSQTLERAYVSRQVVSDAKRAISVLKSSD